MKATAVLLLHKITTNDTWYPDYGGPPINAVRLGANNLRHVDDIEAAGENTRIFSDIVASRNPRQPLARMASLEVPVRG